SWNARGHSLRERGAAGAAGRSLRPVPDREGASWRWQKRLTGIFFDIEGRSAAAASSWPFAAEPASRRWSTPSEFLVLPWGRVRRGVVPRFDPTMPPRPQQGCMARIDDQRAVE